MLGRATTIGKLGMGIFGKLGKLNPGKLGNVGNFGKLGNVGNFGMLGRATTIGKLGIGTLNTNLKTSFPEDVLVPITVVIKEDIYSAPRGIGVGTNPGGADNPIHRNVKASVAALIASASGIGAVRLGGRTEAKPD